MKVGSVEYRPEGAEYFNRRRLKRHAGMWSLWALGVGAVISGDFFGWNFGLSVGGFGGLLVATGIVALMYLGICYSIAEMSSAMPHAGGAYSFARTALGPWGGYVTGVAESIEYILTPAVIVVGIGSYVGLAIDDIFGVDVPAPIWWLVFYAVFVGINIAGAAATFRFAIFITFLALGILIVFWIGAIPNFSWSWATNIQPEGSNSRFLPFGWIGVAEAMPFAIWFYLAIEQIPLAAEESHNPSRDMPKALRWGILTLILASVLTLFLNAGIEPGSAEVGNSDEPLFLAFRTIFGDGVGTSVLALVSVAGLVASFHTIIYAYGRKIFSLSRSGYYPRLLSKTHHKTQTPHWALIAGAVIGYLVALLIEFSDAWFGEDVQVGAVLLNMAVFGAVISYVMKMTSFVILRGRFPKIERPYMSPMGNTGAITAGVIALATLVSLFLNSDYRLGVYGCAICFAVGLAIFAITGRKRLLRSPEEEFALSQRHNTQK